MNQNVGFELNKIGLDVINVNIRDITDESGYIEAIGRKAAAEAVNQAKIEVAEAERTGSIGEATANRDKEVQVANQVAGSAIGQKEAERNRRIQVSKLEADGIAGEADANRAKEIAVAQQAAMSVQGRKQAEMEQRVKVAHLEASAVEGENTSRAQIAFANATLSEREAEAKRRGEVALAQAARDVLQAEKEREVAKLEKEQLAQQMVEKLKVEVDAEAEAERIRRVAKGQADGILAKYLAEAQGIQKVLEAKAHGYEDLIRVCGDRKDLAPSLLIIEKLPELVAEQVKAIQNLRIDKITVWDSGGNGGRGTTAGFLSSLIGALPPMHELAQQAGIDLPQVLGRVVDAMPKSGAKADGGPQKAARPAGPES